MVTTSKPCPQPAVDDPVQLDCGCAGHVRYVRGGAWPTVGVLVKAPCGGHPEPIAAGVILHVAPGAVAGGVRG